MVKIVDNYLLSEVIGKGQYGKVYKATHTNTKITVAIKCIDIKKFEEDSRLTQCTKNEIDTLMLIQDNPHIVKFIQMIKTSNNIYLVYEYCEGGTLDQQIRKQGKLSQRQALLYLKQLMLAFKSVMENKIIHRDIKPDNILFKSGHLKLADFGFCKKMQSVEDLTQTILGSPVYMAPEVLNGQMYNSRADIWSLGIVLFQMLFGYCPFGQGSMSDLMNHIRNFSLQIPKGVISHSTESLLLRMLQRDSFRRMSWDDLFYQYQVSDYGILNKKQKGFEYDLMKLMKKNSIEQKRKNQLRRTISYKFNWDKITQRKSEVKSVELDPNQRISNLDQIIQMKKKIKQLINDHTKCHQAAGVLTQVLRKKFCSESLMIGYFICQKIISTLNSLMRRTIDFQAKNHRYLSTSKIQLQNIQKLLLVLTNEKKNLIPKLNHLKSQLCSSNVQNPEIVKFQQSESVRNKILRRYLKELQNKYHNSQTFQKNELDKDITLHLVKVLVAINISKQKQPLNIGQHNSKIQLIKQFQIRKSQLQL